MPIVAECCCLCQWSRCVFIGIFLRVSGAKKWRGRGYSSPLHREGMRVGRGALRDCRVIVRGRGDTWSVTRRVCRNCGRAYRGKLRVKIFTLKIFDAPNALLSAKFWIQILFTRFCPPQKIRFFELIIIQIQHFFAQMWKKVFQKVWWQTQPFLINRYPISFFRCTLNNTTKTSPRSMCVGFA